MKNIEVSAAVIHDVQNRIFATQRGYGDMKGGWEFPGGKVEPGETPEQALKREISEELEVTVCIERFLQTVEWDYPSFHLTMHCYLCTVESGQLTLKEHEAAKWLSCDELHSLDWLPADRLLLAQLHEICNESQTQIARISQMECLLHRAQAAVEQMQLALDAYQDMQSQITALDAYYGSSQWHADCKADREGRLPENLKRGVLSEDEIYDLLAANKEVLEQLKDLCRE
ncbi:MAG: 8-oxo-dGTP diphosphatase MutT [Paludibacteraceae bacterium]|nr:8-oxo-dGTP diphosphatase MutT [Paludibacteraceae bacterium]